MAGACREIKGASSTQRLMGCMDVRPFLAKQMEDEMEAGVHIMAALVDLLREACSTGRI